MIINFHNVLGPPGYYSRIKVDQILKFRQKLILLKIIWLKS